MTYRIFFINFGYYSQTEYSSLLLAKAAAVKLCFECRIEDSNGKLMISYSPIGGFH